MSVLNNISYVMFVFMSNSGFFSKLCRSVFFSSYNRWIQKILWFDSFWEEKKLPSSRSCLVSVSLAGKGRCCVFGTMVSDNQVGGRKAEHIRRKVFERG